MHPITIRTHHNLYAHTLKANQQEHTTWQNLSIPCGHTWARGMRCEKWCGVSSSLSSPTMDPNVRLCSTCRQIECLDVTQRNVLHTVGYFATCFLTEGTCGYVVPRLCCSPQPFTPCPCSLLRPHLPLPPPYLPTLAAKMHILCTLAQLRPPRTSPCFPTLSSCATSVLFTSCSRSAEWRCCQLSSARCLRKWK